VRSAPKFLLPAQVCGSHEGFESRRTSARRTTADPREKHARGRQAPHRRRRHQLRTDDLGHAGGWGIPAAVLRDQELRVDQVGGRRQAVEEERPAASDARPGGGEGERDGSPGHVREGGAADEPQPKRKASDLVCVVSLFVECEESLRCVPEQRTLLRVLHGLSSVDVMDIRGIGWALSPVS